MDAGPLRPARGAVESSLELLQRARNGDISARERLCEFYLPPMTRWASGRLPRWARDLLDTGDLVQEALLNTLSRLETFEPRREGALQAYLRQAILNRIQDEIRRVHRRPAVSEFNGEELDLAPSPLEEAVGQQVVEKYDEALQRLKPQDREAIVARVEMGLSYARVAELLGKPSIEAAQMAVSRALVRLAREMGHER